MSDCIAHVRQSNARSDADYQSLAAHLKEVGQFASKFADKVGASEAGSILGLLHDFGKYSQAFQDYISSAVGDLDSDDSNYVDAVGLKGKIDHSSAGAQYVWRKFQGLGNTRQGDLVAQILSVCIASHHSGLIDCFDKKNEPRFLNRINKDQNKTHLEECINAADAEILTAVDSLATGNQCRNIYKRLLAFTSGRTQLSRIDYFNLGFFTRFLFSALVDADRLNSAEFEVPSRKSNRQERESFFKWGIAIDRLERALRDFPANYPVDRLRRKISENCLSKSEHSQGLYTLTVPTGGGKTFASLRYALHHAVKHGLDRIIFIIPYTSIIEQNASAIREILEQDGDSFPWVLEQHSNLEPERQTWQSKLVSENWDSPIVLTTMVQFLETCFGGGTRSVRRLHQLAKSVLVFDEIQTLPVNCTHLFCNALNFLTEHCGSTALLCTATQPLLNALPDAVKEKGQLLIPSENEIVADVGNLFDELNRVEIINRIKAKGWDETEVAELALEQFRSKGSCLVIVNTKGWAKNLYQQCKAEVESDCLFHLSTNQCAAHRKQLLDKIKIRLLKHQPVLCISTQLIEAGVDISAACVIRFLAGLDSIAQAAGRCNRHGESVNEQGCPVKGQVFILNPDHEATQSLADIEAGKSATTRVLEDGFDNLVAPEAISRYFQYYFYDRSDVMDYPLDIQAMGRSDNLLNLLSDNRESSRSFKDRLKQGHSPMLSQAFMEAGRQFKAIDAPTQAVIVPFGEGKKIIAGLCGTQKEFDIAHYYQLLRQAQQYSVNVFPNVWDKLMNVEAIHEIQPGFGIYYLETRYYSEKFGLSTEPVALMEDLCV